MRLTYVCSRLLLFFFSTCLLAPTPNTTQARWIWIDGEPSAPPNRFTYFRKTIDLKAIPADATLHFAADSNAHLWINGQPLRRKVTRYFENNITAEVVNPVPALKIGQNVIVVLHHNWGPIVTFQRSGNAHAGIYVDSSWVQSDTSWKAITAPEFEPGDKQITGVIGDPRIRYPEILDGRRLFPGDVHAPGFDERSWKQAVAVTNGPWPPHPKDVETPGQQEYRVHPISLLAAGTLEVSQPLSNDPFSIAEGIRTARYTPSQAARQEASPIVSGHPITIRAHAGESRYITLDFGRPVHGFPFLDLASSTPGVSIDFGYAEVSRSQYSGKSFVRPDGWLDPDAVVGPGYADRYITNRRVERIEMPDERTCRWLTLQLHFATDGEVTFNQVGFVRSQYPVTLLGSFHSGNKKIDEIVQLCLIHAIVSMSDVYVDTPGREDGEWLEDARPRQILAAQWFGDVRLRQLFLRLVAESQGPDGNFHPFPPSNFPAYPSNYDWSLEWVGALHDDYLWTGETVRLRQYWPVLLRYWTQVLSHTDATGLWRTRGVFGDIRVGVHPSSNDQSSGIASAQLIQRLAWSVEMANALGSSGQAAQWQRMAVRMTAAFRRDHIIRAAAGIPAHVDDVFDPENPNAPRGFSQAAQAMATLSGLLQPAEARSVLDYAFPPPDGAPPAGVTRWNNPTYSYRALRALTESGLTSRAVSHLLERYAPYLPADPRNPVPLILQGPFGGPLPEYWVSREDLDLKQGELDTAQPADETGSHGWGSVPLIWLQDSLLGVSVLQPGGAVLGIAPQDGSLPFVEGDACTPKGIVHVNWQRQTDKLEVTVPDGVTAVITLPPLLAGAPRLKVSSNCKATGKVYNCRTGLFTFAAE